MSKKRSSTAADQALPFEKILYEIESRIEKTDSPEEKQQLGAELEAMRAKTFSEITPWQRVQLARHPLRPRMLDYTGRLFDDFIELHGDRVLGDDPAMVCGIAQFHGETVFVAGQQKGVNTDEKVRRNFGMAHPTGYRKALRIFKLAEKFGYPIVTFVDTPAAHPGIEAEQYGQGLAIALNLLHSSALRTPILSIILSEGGSGGALGIAVGDWVAMFEYAVYMICPPERCAEILWRDAEKRELAATALKVSATDLKSLGVIDNILPEPPGGAHRAPDAAAEVVRGEIAWFLDECRKGSWNVARRQKKFRAMGRWSEGQAVAST